MFFKTAALAAILCSRLASCQQTMFGYGELVYTVTVSTTVGGTFGSTGDGIMSTAFAGLYNQISVSSTTDTAEVTTTADGFLAYVTAVTEAGSFADDDVALWGSIISAVSAIDSAAGHYAGAVASIYFENTDDEPADVGTITYDMDEDVE
ncbi:uncharacterized protein LY89DRAFT_663219 [Mollisia scopiformis]|uniref:Uncharacterized protein n=1 Tax=Mollisia scopiformis TaxID=149040 RepID=A0A194XWS9_MOLSC|nr:uncharacterized protein LY89DRAFT_663219 [Mollisia scopiformis]KUJ24489.1 hypothetical protein LY89DRAFT_663219 [Mollisia scopiformis]